MRGGQGGSRTLIRTLAASRQSRPQTALPGSCSPQRAPSRAGARYARPRVEGPLGRKLPWKFPRIGLPRGAPWSRRNAPSARQPKPPSRPHPTHARPRANRPISPDPAAARPPPLETGFPPSPTPPPATGSLPPAADSLPAQWSSVWWARPSGSDQRIRAPEPARQRLLGRSQPRRVHHGVFPVRLAAELGGPSARHGLRTGTSGRRAEGVLLYGRIREGLIGGRDQRKPGVGAGPRMAKDMYHLGLICKPRAMRR